MSDPAKLSVSFSYGTLFLSSTIVGHSAETDEYQKLTYVTVNIYTTLLPWRGPQVKLDRTFLFLKLQTTLLICKPPSDVSDYSGLQNSLHEITFNINVIWCVF